MLLESMKKGIGKYVMIVLASLLILSFAVWGLGDMAGMTSNPNEIATIGSTEISQREFRDQFRREMDRLTSRVGNIDAAQARNLGIVDATLNGLISRRLIALQAADLGLLISDEQVIQRIQQQPAFRNAVGQFDRAVFQTTLANNGLSEDMYVASLRNDTQQDYIAGTITTGLKAPPSLVRKVYQYQNEKRTAEIVRTKRPKPAGAPEPTIAELAEFLEENAASFMSPEYRRLTVLYLNPEEVAKKLSPSEENIQTEYEDRLTSLSVPERRRIEQILLQDEAVAKRAHASLKKGRSFSDVAEDASDTSKEEIKLGLVVRGDLLPTLADAAFTLAKDSFTEPVKSPLGWHIMRVTEIQPGHVPKLEEVRKQISNDLALDLALDDLVRLANQVEDGLAGGGSIDDVARNIGANVMKTPPVDSQRKLRTGAYQPGLPTSQRFMDTAFSLERGTSSDLLETSDGGYFMVRVDDIAEAAKRSLEQARTEVAAKWKADWLDKRARKAAEEIRDAIRSGTTFASAASEKGLSVATSQPVSRLSSRSDNTVPRSLIEELFNARVGDVVIGPTEDGYAIARLKEIKSAMTDTNDSDLNQLQKMLSSAIANDVLTEYTLALRQEYAVKVNQVALDAYFANQDNGR